MFALRGAKAWRDKAWCDWLVLTLLLLGCQQLGAAGVIKAKALLAPVLVERAWESSLGAGGSPIKPWPWADTWPVARLEAPDVGVNLLVLAGDSGNALAFGPGHSNASAQLGSAGLAVIGGHRDTHFAFLQKLQRGSLLKLQLTSGFWREYRVESIEVVDSRVQSLPRASPQERLLLVTCYPFDALLFNGPLRYVVAAVPVASAVIEL